MKKLLVLVIAFLVFGFLAIAIPVSLRYDYIQYEKDMLAHDLKLQDGGDLVAEYHSQKTRILGGNIERLEWAMTLTERQRVFKKPSCESAEAVTIDFPDGARYIVVADPVTVDKIYIFYTYKGKDRCYSIQGYNAMSWIVKAISPEGVSSANEVLN